MRKWAPAFAEPCMVKEATSDNQPERDAVAKAIAALKARGCDVNPYSVADEAEIPRGTLARNAELLRLVGEARGDGKNGSGSSSATAAEPGSEVEALQRELKQAQWENSVLRRYFQEAQAENKKLQEEMGRVQEEATNIAKSINVAYQQGYFAGQLASGMPISAEPKVAAATPAAAAASGTSGGGTVAEAKAEPAPTPIAAAPEPVAPALAPEPVAPARAPEPVAAAAEPVAPAPAPEPVAPAAAPTPAPEPVAAAPQPEPAVAASTVSGAPATSNGESKREAYSITQEITPAASAGSDMVTAYVADVPLHIADPEVLNDPFTAKLLNALNAEGTLTQEIYDYDELNAETVAIRPLTPEDLLEPFPENVVLQEGSLTVAAEPEAAPAAAQVAQPAPQPAPQPVAAGAPVKRVKSPQELAETLDRIPKPDLSKAPAAQAVAEPVVAQTATQPAPPQTVVESVTTHMAPEPQIEQEHSEQPGNGNGSESEAAPGAPAAPDDYDEEDEIAKVIAAKGGSIASKYTADELHNLFRNRYVKGEEAPPEQPVESKPAAKNLESSQPTKKFVGTNKATQGEGLPTTARAFPPEIRKACRLLGLNPEDLTRPLVFEAWKREMSKPGVHPDTGGDTEMAIYLNTAKDTLIRWVDDQTPKLGKKFGQKAGEKQPKPKAE
jgi:hypothetical protein